MSSGKLIGEMSFEEAMQALETVVAQLERGDAPLDRSIEYYERGAALKKHCEAKLDEAREKVAAIALDEDGRPTGMRPLDET